jgi:sec-independent protein translocase protein TatA
MDVLFAMFSPGPPEMLIILAVAVLLFGKRLPEVGRSLGRSLVEFKKGIRGIEDEIDSSTSTSSVPTSHDDKDVDDHDEATAPKFEPPTAEPTAEESAADATETAQAEPSDESKAESAEA